jgi:hypothetical protein
LLLKVIFQPDEGLVSLFERAKVDIFSVFASILTNFFTFALKKPY